MIGFSISFLVDHLSPADGGNALCMQTPINTNKEEEDPRPRPPRLPVWVHQWRNYTVRSVYMKLAIWSTSERHFVISPQTSTSSFSVWMQSTFRCANRNENDLNRCRPDQVVLPLPAGSHDAALQHTFVCGSRELLIRSQNRLHLRVQHMFRCQKSIFTSENWIGDFVQESSKTPFTVNGVFDDLVIPS